MATIPNSWRFPVFCLGALLTCASVEAHGQQYTPPPPKLVPGPCVPTKEYPCDPPPKAPAPAPPTQFPFPGENPGSSPDAPPDQQADPSAPKPASATPAAPNPDKQKAFPFPGEPPDDPASSSSSSSSSSDTPPAENPGDTGNSPGNSPIKDAGSTGSTRFQRKHLAKVEDLDKRELEDIDVSHYYLTTGNFTASYARAQDAVKLYPDDENAHFALAAAADKLNKKDEATAEYTTYLKLASDGPKAKEARRALEKLK